MHKIITVTGIIVIAAIAIAWSMTDRPGIGTKTETSTVSTPMPPEVLKGSSLPVEYWADPF